VTSLENRSRRRIWIFATIFAAIAAIAAALGGAALVGQQLVDRRDGFALANRLVD
jgi:hypothetical protein